jgi:hypothetical protein
MDEALPVDPLSGKFFDDFFMGELKPIALRWCRGEEVEALDLVHDTAKWFYDWKPWEKGLRYEEWLPYTVKVMKRIHYRGILKEPLTESFDNLDGATKDKVESDSSSSAQQAQYMAERRLLASKVMPLFDGNKQIQEFVYYKYFCDMTRAEIATKMGLPPRKVTDLERQFLYRVTPEVAIKDLGLVPREYRV